MSAFFTIVIPSYLGHYPNAATHRDKKIIRALNSVFQQTFDDYEIQFIADGCEASYNAITSLYSHDSRLHCTLLPKQPKWSGLPRNIAIRQGGGKYAVYLDIDDFWGCKHLEGIWRSLRAYNSPVWGFFNDFLGQNSGRFLRRHCDPEIKFKNGTSNIVHRTDSGAQWTDGYLHDYLFIKQLHCIAPPALMDCGEYCVCHIPKVLDI